MSITKISVGSRLSYQGELCTVKYVGELPVWPGEVAYGVEWDNNEKGKHNGSFKGVQYFKTIDDLKSGSFLKSTKEQDNIQGFHEALVHTYATAVEDKEIKIGTKFVESYGFQKLQRLQSDFNYLKNISLSRKCIAGTVEQDKIPLIAEGLKNLEVLDLAFNLFTDLSEILTIVEHLKLKKLNLTGNRFEKLTHAHIIPHLTSLNLTLTKPSTTLLNSLSFVFPDLASLYLQDNSFDSIIFDTSKIGNLTTLDLSMNRFKSLPFQLTNIETLTTLIISENLISIRPSNLIFSSVTTLDIRRNEISSWKELETLETLFPNLEELRISGNPIFDGKTLEEVEFVIIAMFSSIKVLNGVELTEQDRINAELYFLSKLGEGDIDYKSPRLAYLCEKHGKDIKIIKVLKNNIDSNIIQLRLQNNTEIIKIQVIENLELLRLRGLIARLFKKNVLDFQITFFIGEYKEVLKNDISLISSFKFDEGQLLYIEDI